MIFTPVRSAIIAVLPATPALAPYADEQTSRIVASGTIGQERLAADLVGVVRAWLETLEQNRRRAVRISARRNADLAPVEQA